MSLGLILQPDPTTAGTSCLDPALPGDGRPSALGGVPVAGSIGPSLPLWFSWTPATRMACVRKYCKASAAAGNDDVHGRRLPSWRRGHEAMSFSEDDNESIDVKVQKALECPCVADLKSGPCGSGFVDAFSCFLRSTEVEKGSDCVEPFIALQNCIKENPAAFSKEILEEEENDEEAEKSNLKVRAPAWSREAKPKL